jgi:hypothetical protein
MKLLFGQVLPSVGLSEPQSILSGDRWALWRATEERAFGEAQTLHLLYFDSRAVWGTVDEAVEEAKSRILTSRQRYHAICQNSSVLARDIARLQKASGAVSALTVRQMLSKTIGQRLGGQFQDEEAGRLFVPPDLRPASPELDVTSSGPVLKAIPALADWLMDDSDTGSRVGVLVANAGVGKTTVARQLFRHLRGKDGKGRFPILVESDQWARLSDRSSLSLWDVWRESLDTLYNSSLARDDFEIGVEYGLFLPIFDGFDELCTRLGAHFVIGETLTQLLQLLEDTEGRILLTTRDAFWLEALASSRRAELRHFRLLAFNKQQTAKYLENRFRQQKDFEKREVADKILQRIAQLAHAQAGEEMPEVRQRLTAVPLVVTLAAECADIEASEAAVLKYGTLLSSDDPLEGLLLILFERETERRKLSLTPEQQFELFAQLAFNCGDAFSEEQLRLFAGVSGLTEQGSQMEALRSHALLKVTGADYAFRFEFLGRYLAAHALVKNLLNDPNNPKVERFLESESRGGTLVIERAVDCLFARHLENLLQTLSVCWAGTKALSGPARSGLAHIIMKATEKEAGPGPRSDRTAALAKVFGTANPQSLDGLYLEGTITGLDLRGVKFSNSSFLNAGFSKCVFDRSTQFERCTFEGAFDVEDCEDFGEASYLECSFGPRAREVVQLNDPSGRLEVTEEQVRWTVRLALQAFQKGVNFKAIPLNTCKRGRILTSPICDEVWRTLEEHGIVCPITIPGLLEHGVQVHESKRDEVHLFLSNALLTGSLREAVRSILKKAGTPKVPA